VALVRGIGALDDSPQSRPDLDARHACAPFRSSSPMRTVPRRRITSARADECESPSAFATVAISAAVGSPSLPFEQDEILSVGSDGS